MRWKFSARFRLKQKDLVQTGMILTKRAVILDARTRISRSVRMIRESSRANNIVCVNEPEAVVNTGRQLSEAGLRIASLKASELLIRALWNKTISCLVPLVDSKSGG